MSSSEEPTPSRMEETVEIRRPLAPLPERYDSISELGRGGMGIVYRARDRETGEVLAIKILKPEIAADTQVLERFKNELRLAHRITHRNVARLYEFHRAGDTVFVSMEFIEGESLRARMDREGRLDPEQAMAIARQLLTGIGEAHRQSIVHRDLKPENVMLTPAGEVKVMDFGISRSYAAGVTATGAIIGTPAYMAPEQAEGKATDQRTDIYACGLILYEMFTGEPAFRGETPVSVALKQIRETPQAPRKIAPGVAREIDDAILKCLEKDPDKRFDGVEQLAAALEGAAAGRAQSRKKRIPALPVWLAAVAFAVVALAVTAWWIVENRPAASLRFPIEQFTLPNGLPVVLSADHGAPAFTLTAAYRAGAHTDPMGRAGLALLVAHLMQQGSANVGAGEHQSLVEEAGGDHSYGTSEDLSYFSSTLPSNQLEMALFLESDRMRGLAITPQGMEAARSYVLEQIADQRNYPYAQAVARIVQLSFSNPVNQRQALGSPEDLKNTTLDDVTRFYKSYYTPSNAVLTLAGDFDPKAARERITHYFGDIPAGSAPPPPETRETSRNGERRDVLRDPSAHVPVVLFGYPVAPITQPGDWFPLQSLMQLLAGGPAARLQARLVDGAGIATGIEGYLENSTGPNLFWFAVIAVPGKDLRQIERLALAEIHRVASDGVPPDELQRLRMEALREREMSLVPSAARSLELAQLVLDGFRPRALNEREDYIRKLTSARLQQVAKKYLTDANRTVVIVIPGGAH